MSAQSDNEIETQLVECLNLLKDTLGKDVLGVYLYGSSIIGGLQKYSDIDLFVVLNRPTTHNEKSKLVASLLTISGVYKKSLKRSIEMTIVVRSEINPWHHPPQFDFQYGDWLRKEFESGNIEPWPTKEMPDLALLITQVLLASKTLFGPNPDQLLSKVPHQDFMLAMIGSLDSLMTDLNSDTFNVLLTLSRIWSTMKTDQIRSKTDAAAWAINQLPEKYQPVIKRACAIYIGEENEHWDDIEAFIQPCAEFMINKINVQISSLTTGDYTSKSIKYAE